MNWPSMKVLKIDLCLSIALLILPALVFPQAKERPPFGRGVIRGLPFPENSPGGKILRKEGFLVPGWRKPWAFSVYKEKGPPSFITLDSCLGGFLALAGRSLAELEARQEIILRKLSLKLAEHALDAGGGSSREIALYAGIGCKALGVPLSKKKFSGLREKIEKNWLEWREKLSNENLSNLTLNDFAFHSGENGWKGFWKGTRWFRAPRYELTDLHETLVGLWLIRLVAGNPELMSMRSVFSKPWADFFGSWLEDSFDEWKCLAEKVGGVNWFQKDPRSFLKKFIEAGAHGIGGKKLHPLSLLPRLNLPSARFFRNLSVRRWVNPTQNGTIPSYVFYPFKGNPSSGGLYGRYLQILKGLTCPPPPGAPPVFYTLSWRKKQAWTRFGCWASIQQLGPLNRKIGSKPFCGHVEGVGYVSPYPDVFKRLSQLSDAFREWVVSWWTIAGAKYKKRKTFALNGCSGVKKVVGAEHFFSSSLAGAWNDFSFLCLELSWIAQKEIRGRALSKNDYVTISDFGDSLEEAYSLNYFMGLPDKKGDCFLVRVGGGVGKNGKESVFCVGNLKWANLLIVLPECGKERVHQGAVLDCRTFSLPPKQEFYCGFLENLQRRGKWPGPPGFTRIFHLP